MGIGLTATLFFYANLQNQEFGRLSVAPAGMYPNLSITPGAVDTTSFKVLTLEKACGTYSKCHRGSSMKATVCQYYSCKGKVEIDHFIPLALGGADDIKNLWAQPEHVIIDNVDWGYHTKDKLEVRLISMMKRGKITPKEAQKCIKKDWVDCYKKHIGITFGSTLFIEDYDGEDEI